MSHETHYRSYRDNQQCQSTEGREVLRIRLQSNQVHPTMFTIIQQLCSMKHEHTKYKQINTNKSTHSEMVPVWQNPIQRTVRKNCSSNCAYDCAQLQYTIQHRTVLIISPLTSRQTSFHWCISKSTKCH